MIKKIMVLSFVYLFWFLPDKPYLHFAYFLKMNKRLNLKKPLSFNEKINWLKLNDKNPLKDIVTDKYKVREYVSKNIGSQVLVPLLWKGEDPEAIPFDSLPKAFVIKSNEGSGKNFIVTNKNEINTKKIKKTTKLWLKSNYSYMFGRERCYEKTNRLLLVEQYIGNDTDLPVDYKFFMADGVFIMLEYCFSRKINSQREVKIEYLNPSLVPYSEDSIFEKPNNFEQMLDYAKILSRKFNFVRVDFYSVNNKVYFGEMTLYPSSGWKVFPENNMDISLGEKLSIDIV